MQQECPKLRLRLRLQQQRENSTLPELGIAPEVPKFERFDRHKSLILWIKMKNKRNQKVQVWTAKGL
jgi:hypothetical protein